MNFAFQIRMKNGIGADILMREPEPWPDIPGKPWIVTGNNRTVVSHFWK
jgi:hypothetical protein